MRRIVQVELCNHCNRRCVYCGIPTMKRPKGFITFDTIKRVAEVCKLIGQTEWLGVHHFGESTLHSQLVEFIKYFNDNGIQVREVFWLIFDRLRRDHSMFVKVIDPDGDLFQPVIEF